MRSAALIVVTLWIVFWLYWIVSAARAKRTVRTPGWWQRQILARIVLIALVAALFNAPAIRHFLTARGVSNPVTGSIGVLLCFAGLAFAVWARIHIGRNWGVPMSVKQDPELVTSGPYRYVRHPIYGGMLVAMLGSSLVQRETWTIFFMVFAAYCLYSAFHEEKLMTQQFPDRYPAYRKRTRMLIPFVL